MFGFIKRFFERRKRAKLEAYIAEYNKYKNKPLFYGLDEE